MGRATIITATLTVALASSVARAQDLGDAAPSEAAPVYSTDERWARPMLIGVGTLFAAALGVGGFVWMNARDLIPPAASHEEDPSADRR